MPLPRRALCAAHRRQHQEVHGHSEGCGALIGDDAFGDEQPAVALGHGWDDALEDADAVRVGVVVQDVVSIGLAVWL